MSTHPHISRRAASIEGSPTLEIAAVAAAMRAEGKDVVSFTAGEPDMGTPPLVDEIAIAAIRGAKGRYTSAAGLPELRRAISERFAKDGYSYAPDAVMAVAGAKSGLYMALYACVEEGEEVIFPSPFWGSYTELVRAVGGVPRPLPCDAAHDYQPEIARMAAMITPRTRAILLNSPNNPTGTVYSRETLLGVAELARRHDLTIISDDIYDCLVYSDEPFLNVLKVAPDLADRTIIVNSLSKSHSMTGWRFGFVGGPKPLIQVMARVQSQISGNPNTIAQLAAIAALRGEIDPTRRQSLNERRKLMVQELAKVPGVTFPVPRGAFYVFLCVSNWIGRSWRGQRLESSAQIADVLLNDMLVAIVPGEAFGAPAHIRLTYTVSEAHIREGVTRLARFASELT